MPSFVANTEERVDKFKLQKEMKNGKQSYDRRHPLYVGDWLRSLAWRDNDFARENLDDPHPKRRQTILNNHPEMIWLYHHKGWYSNLITVFMVAVQLVMAFGFGRVWNCSWFTIILSAYAIGGSMIHIAGIIMHEACHGLVGDGPLSNKLWGLVANSPIPVPIALSFRRYHLEHHTYQGVEGKDPDLPIPIELPLIRGSTWKKFIWMGCYPLMYVLRGAYFGKSPSTWEIINWVVQLTIDVVLYQVVGPVGLTYLLLSLWLGYSFHPVAAHFIQEHYTFTDGQETYSYYGWSNWLFLNIGFHNEHHDFPNIPWNLLPLVKQYARESYEPLAYHGSWRAVLWNFITDKNLGPQSRVVRTPEDQKKTRKEFASSVRSGKSEKAPKKSDVAKPIGSNEIKAVPCNSHVVPPVKVS